MRSVRHVVWCLALLCLLGALRAAGQATLDIRLAEAHRDGQGVDPRLEDVAGLLTQNLPFPGFRLLEQRQLPLPADRTMDMKQGVSLALSGPASALQVRMARGTETIKATYVLQPGKPVVVVGFATGTSRIVLVLQLRDGP